MTQQTEMDMETEIAETAPLLSVVEEEKDWSLTNIPADWEDAFTDPHNFTAVLNFAKDRARNLVADPTTDEGRIVRKSLAKRIGQVQKFIEERGMEVARVLKEKPKKIDATRKKVKDTLLMYKDEVLAPLKEIEERQAQIVEIQNLPAQGIGCDSAGIKELLARLDDESKKDWKESKDDAEDSIRESRRQLTDMLARVEKEEADKAELERLRRQEAERAAEREEELRKAREAAQKAEAEKAEAERKAREAEEARKKAEEEAAKANEAKVQAEADKAKAEAMVPDWKKNEVPQENLLFPDDEKERKRKINRDAMDAIAKIIGSTPVMMGPESVAKEIVKAIALGKIPRVYMDYTF